MRTVPNYFKINFKINFILKFKIRKRHIYKIGFSTIFSRYLKDFHYFSSILHYLIRPRNINWHDWEYTSFEIFIRNKSKHSTSQCNGLTCCGRRRKHWIETSRCPVVESKVALFDHWNRVFTHY